MSQIFYLIFVTIFFVIIQITESKFITSYGEDTKTVNYNNYYNVMQMNSYYNSYDKTKTPTYKVKLELNFQSELKFNKLSKNDIMLLFKRSLIYWGSIIDLELVSNNYDKLISLTFGDMNGFKEFCGNQQGVLACCGGVSPYIKHSKMYFRTDLDYNHKLYTDEYNIIESEEYGLYQIMTHEVGHALGLNHIKNRNCFVYDYYDSQKPTGNHFLSLDIYNCKDQIDKLFINYNPAKNTLFEDTRKLLLTKNIIRPKTYNRVTENLINKAVSDGDFDKLTALNKIVYYTNNINEISQYVELHEINIKNNMYTNPPGGWSKEALSLIEYIVPRNIFPKETYTTRSTIKYFPRTNPTIPRHPRVSSKPNNDVAEDNQEASICLCVKRQKNGKLEITCHNCINNYDIKYFYYNKNPSNELLIKDDYKPFNSYNGKNFYLDDNEDEIFYAITENDVVIIDKIKTETKLILDNSDNFNFLKKEFLKINQQFVENNSDSTFLKIFETKINNYIHQVIKINKILNRNLNEKEYLKKLQIDFKDVKFAILHKMLENDKEFTTFIKINNYMILSIKSNLYLLNLENQDEVLLPISTSTIFKNINENINCMTIDDKNNIYIFTENTFYKYDIDIGIKSSSQINTFQFLNNEKITGCSIVKNKLFLITSFKKYYVIKNKNDEKFCEYPKNVNLLFEKSEIRSETKIHKINDITIDNIKDLYFLKNNKIYKRDMSKEEDAKLFLLLLNQRFQIY